MPVAGSMVVATALPTWPPPPTTGGGSGGAGGVAGWVGLSTTGTVGLGTCRRQFGGLPTNGGGHVAAATQFGGVPVRPGGQNLLLP
jgi:hypothetical protein